ncbi:hypothetical protein EAI_03848, partial [Harpegnathos saltator]
LDCYFLDKIREIVYVNPPTTKKNKMQRTCETCQIISTSKL